MDNRDNSSHGLLLVVGDQKVQNYVYETMGCAYWSAQFSLVLEKNGLLDFEVTGQDILHQADYLSRFPIVVVGWLPEAFWQHSYIDTLNNYQGVLILEGPPPAALQETLGLRPAAGPSTLAGEIEIVDPALAGALTQRYDAYLKAGRITITPKNIHTRPVRPNRWDNDIGLDSLETTEIAKRVVRSFRIPFWNRLMRGTASPLARDELLNLYFLLWDRAKGGETPPEGIQALASRLDALTGHLDTPLERAIANEIYSLLGNEPSLAPKTGGTRSVQALWHRVTTLARRMRSRAQELSATGEDLLETLIGLPLASPPERLPEKVAARLRARIEGDLILDEVQLVPRRQLTLAELALCAVILKVLGQQQEAERVLHLCLDAGFDWENGRFTNMRLGPEGQETLSHHTTSPFLALAFLAVLDETREAPFVGLRFRDRYGAALVDGWHAAPYRLRPYVATGGQPAAVLHGEVSGPAVVRSGKRICFTFEVLSYIVYYHTMHPLDGPFTDCDASGAMTLEALFLGLLHQQSARYTAGLVRIEPWPWGSDYCFTLRHDVDRIPDAETLEALMEVEKEAGLGVSWFWLPNRLRADYIARQETAGHEIALHALKHESKDREIAVVAQHLTHQPQIYGEFVHGGGGGEYWLGYPSVEAARQAGFTYTEGMSTYYDFPYRFPYLTADGEVCLENVVSMSHTISVDIAAPDGEGEARPWHKGRVSAAIDNGFYLMVLNHPDKHLHRLGQLLSDLPAAGRLDWTCKQVAQWWRTTHHRDQLHVARIPSVESSHAYVVRANGDVEDVALRLVGIDADQVRLNGVVSNTRFEARACPGLYSGSDALIRLSLPAGRSLYFEARPAPASRQAAGAVSA